jgi:hypothetical protein
MFYNRSTIYRGFSITAATLALILFTIPTVRADTVDIQITTPAPYSNGASFSGQQGAFTGDGIAAPVWNVNLGTTSENDLVNSAGIATGISYTLTFNSGDSTNFFSDTTDTALPTLLMGYAFVNNNNAYPSPNGIVNLTGLIPNGQYQLYMYSQNTKYDSNGATFSITQGNGGPSNGSTSSAINTGNNTTFQLGVNYVIFTATANNAGDLGITWTPNNGGTEGDFNGLQITAVPEPATLGLIAVSGLGLLLISRKRSILT